MTNHPNRSRGGDNPSRNPAPGEIRAAREVAGLTQREASEIVLASLRNWQQWEGGERGMHPGLWKLFLLETAQHAETE